MPAINQSSTTSPAPWQITLEPSRLQLLIRVLLLLCALQATWSCLHRTALASVWIICGCAVIAAFGVWQCVTRWQPSSLCFEPEHGWTRVTPNGRSTAGQRVATTCRSSWLLVMIVQRRDGRRVPITVWRDSVTREAFSALHWHLDDKAPQRHCSR